MVAIDGTQVAVPESAANLTVFAKQGCFNGGSGYPSLRLVGLVACGTRSMIAAAFGPARIGESGYAARLAGHLKPGMLLLADRNFFSADLLGRFAAGGADLLVRCKTGKTSRRLPSIGRLADGTHLARIGPLTVRVIDAEITIATSAGSRTGFYRLITTLTDERTYPSNELIKLYHERWEIETTHLELKSTILGGRVLRARTPVGIEQETWALLTTYQVIRIAMTDATDSRPGTDPDRASFTVAVNAARDQVILAAGIITDTVVDLVGTIGRHVLAALMPDRRVRTKPRIVKRAISKYNARGPNINRTTYKATISIAMLTTEP